MGVTSNLVAILHSEVQDCTGLTEQIEIGLTSNQVAILHSEAQLEIGLTSNQVAILKRASI